MIGRVCGSVGILTSGRSPLVSSKTGKCKLVEKEEKSGQDEEEKEANFEMNGFLSCPLWLSAPEGGGFRLLFHRAAAKQQPSKKKRKRERKQKVLRNESKSIFLSLPSLLWCVQCIEAKWRVKGRLKKTKPNEVEQEDHRVSTRIDIVDTHTHTQKENTIFNLSIAVRDSPARLDAVF